MRMAVCEDSFAEIDFLKKEIPNALAQLNLHIETDYYRSGEELVTAVNRGEAYELILLDIYMRSLDGVQTAEQVRNFLPDVQIAFLTISREFMLEAFDLNALHYLIKPVTAAKLKECFERFCDRVRIPLQMMEIKSPFKTYSFPLIHVQKLVSSNKGVDIYLRSEERPRHIPLSFARAEEQLDMAWFLRISRGFIVQFSFILCIDGDVCRLKDGTETLISRKDKAEIRRRYNNYLFRT